MSWLKKLLCKTKTIGEEVPEENYENIVRLEKSTYPNKAFPCETLPGDWFVSLNFREWLDGEMAFFEVALGVMTDLLASYQVISYINSCNFRCKQKNLTIYSCNTCCLFSSYYYEFLQAHDLAQRAFFKHPLELITITDGLNLPLVKAVAFDTFRDNQNAFYYYKSIPFSCSTFDELKNGIAQADFDMKLVYTEEHDNLAIHINTKTVDADHIINQIKAICSAHGKTLRIYL